MDVFRLSDPAHTITGQMFFCFFYLETVVGPAAEFHVAFLIVEREPCDVDLARAFEYARRYEYTAAVVVDHHVGSICAVETFVSAKTRGSKKRLTHPDDDHCVHGKVRRHSK